MQFQESTIEIVGPPGPRLTYFITNFRSIFAKPVGWIHTYPLPVPYVTYVLKDEFSNIQTIQPYNEMEYRTILEELMRHLPPFNTIICEDFPVMYRCHPFLVAFRHWVEDHSHQVIFLSSKPLKLFGRTIMVDKPLSQRKVVA